jgi:hypothetical protein
MKKDQRLVALRSGGCGFNDKLLGGVIKPKKIYYEYN